MQKGSEFLTTYRIRHIKVLIVWAILIILISVGSSYDLKTAGQKQDNLNVTNLEIPLLLSSGSTAVDYANIDLTMWFETSKIPDVIWEEKPMPDWIWNSEILETASHNTAITISGEGILDKSQEKELFKWYTTMAPIIERAGGRIYLDERVPQVIDVAVYFSKRNTVPTQWILTGNLISVAAYQKNIETSIMAGPDKINVQLVSRGDRNEGQTVLAIPVLLNEF